MTLACVLAGCNEKSNGAIGGAAQALVSPSPTPAAIGIYNVKDWGAKGDCVYNASTGAISGTVKIDGCYSGICYGQASYVIRMP